MRALYLMQNGSSYVVSDDRIHGGSPTVTTVFEQPLPPAVARQFGTTPAGEALTLVMAATPAGFMRGRLGWREDPARSSLSVSEVEGGTGEVGEDGAASRDQELLTNVRPDHYVVPVFARRKADTYDSSPNVDMARQVGPSDRYLTGRVEALGGDHAEGRRYRELMSRTVGVDVRTYRDAQGVHPGISLSTDDHVSLDRMGEGVSGVLGLCAELAAPGPRLFLMEEPETDLHPAALRAVLDLIVEAVSEGSQFVVSTHSDLVLRFLGATEGAVVYRTQLTEESGVPTTSYVELASSFDRSEALVELGYGSSIPTAWLLFEEASAADVVRRALIPLFAPRLAGVVETVSSRGAGNLPAYLEELYRTVLFVHLSDRDRPLAWVFADGDAAGSRALEKVRSAFTGWPSERFVQWTEAAFESYYPERFAERVAEVDDIDRKDWRSLAEAKGALAREVVAWAGSAPDAREELAVSAAEVVGALMIVERTLGGLAI